ncbi:hypothetical protein ERICI_00085 [Paenibacillus larvae subsp. larvae]|uniref:Uncharacterized protein n=2 Tax=Paenibacillus larvae subsp. larvae TaxID=147375 RepID=V9W490_9BACL|nr:hypothetical protein ERIC2_c00811 [Paenibacillus larvae subsp. larvae DSM 25430]AVF20100.1 hypothetical protein ERICI_00085 [Paenibacillus larvae subsp. larvae]ETK29190.1 hypothetical protein ERIC1_1c26950 [Paenibacillus larvae subsp. larvae DSM 25719]AVF24351.1 hypothetical protein ERICIII_00085 [Paenibacillus larvae subsp. larvae]AVF29112.1 hypothetical protein ERICIV_00085 [Paenibacillus larvae subsp. larvae]
MAFFMFGYLLKGIDKYIKLLERKKNGEIII